MPPRMHVQGGSGDAARQTVLHEPSLRRIGPARANGSGARSSRIVVRDGAKVTASASYRHGSGATARHHADPDVT
jgi:hypothetical protein